MLVSIRLQEPFSRNWKNDFLNFFPNLKGISFRDRMVKMTYLETKDFLENEHFGTEENFLIWKNRILFLQARGIQILPKTDFLDKWNEIPKNIPWVFKFY